MPITWDETSPADADAAGSAAGALRSLKANLASGLSVCMNWPGSGGGSVASAGVPKIGSTRAYFGPESQVSTVADGALMLTSDTSRLFAVNSATTVFLGGSRLVESSVTTGLSSNDRYVLLTGAGLVNGSVLTYGVTFATAPIVVAQPQFNPNQGATCLVLRDQPSTQSCLIDAYYLSSGASLSASTVTIFYQVYGPLGF